MIPGFEQAAARLTPDGVLELRVGVHSHGQVYGGNVDLRPEQRWISEVGYERRFWGQGVVSVTYRHDEIIGVIDRLPLPGGLSATGNIGDGTLDKLSVNLVVPTDKLGVGGGRITFKNDWNDSHVTDPTTGRKRPISRVRPTQADIGFQQDLPRWKTQWGFDVIPLLGQGTYDPDQTYKVCEVNNAYTPGKAILVSPRTFCLSPFGDNQIFIGGHDSSRKISDDMAWIFRAPLKVALGLTPGLDAASPRAPAPPAPAALAPAAAAAGRRRRRPRAGPGRGRGRRAAAAASAAAAAAGRRPAAGGGGGPAA